MNKRARKKFKQKLAVASVAGMEFSALTKGQLELQKKHGTPSEFAVACYQCVPGDISMAEASEAVLKYLKEWNDAE